MLAYVLQIRVLSCGGMAGRTANNKNVHMPPIKKSKQYLYSGCWIQKNIKQLFMFHLLLSPMTSYACTSIHTYLGPHVTLWNEGGERVLLPLWCVLERKVSVSLLLLLDGVVRVLQFQLISNVLRLFAGWLGLRFGPFSSSSSSNATSDDGIK